MDRSNPAGHRFADLEGNGNEGHHVICPIIKQFGDGRLKLVGTAFFISSFGLFASARHVLLDCFDSSGIEKIPIALVQFPQGNFYQLRHIFIVLFDNVSDFGVGLVEPSMDARPNAVLELTTSSPSVGEKQL